MSMSSAPLTPTADEKDWSWVTRRTCTDCGFDPGSVAPKDLPKLILAMAERFAIAVELDGSEVRPEPQVWSCIEYGRHVADVIEVMTRRLQLILGNGGAPVAFENWDQDAAAVEEEYWNATPGSTALLIRERAEDAAKVWAQPEGGQWDWVGLRGDGAEFTARTLGLYFAHDLIHHLYDVGG